MYGKHEDLSFMKQQCTCRSEFNEMFVLILFQYWRKILKYS
jgi:hypothetical protein